MLSAEPSSWRSRWRPCWARSWPASSGASIGRAGAHWVTIRAWPLSCALSAWVLKQLVWDGVPVFNQNLYTWFQVGGIRGPRRLPGRPPDRDDDGGGDLRLADGAHLHHRLHGRGPRLPALLRLHRAVHLRDADAGDEQQLPAAVLRLGSGGPGLVPADRLLVQAAERDLRQPQGLPGQPGRRLRLPAGHRRRDVLARHAGLRHRLRQRGLARRQDRGALRRPAVVGRRP